MEAGRGLGVIAAFAAAVFVWVALLMPETPPPPLDALAGVYANPCCGSFTVGNGRLSTGSLNYPVEVGQDKRGVFILPKKHFGVFDGSRLDFNSGFPLKLYVNRKSNPPTIQVDDIAASTTYNFVRTAKVARVG